MSERPSQEPQQQLAADILDMLPAGQATTLSVVTETASLSADLGEMAGVQNLAWRHGSPLQLPYPDKSFDRLIANGILEHLTEDELTLTVSEMSRVAKQSIAVIVPALADDSGRPALCAQCREKSAKGRPRIFHERSLTSLMPPPWRAVEVRYSGGEGSPRQDPTLSVRAMVHHPSPAEAAPCLSCGAVVAGAEMMERVFSSLAAESWWAGSHETPSNDRSHLIGLFSVDIGKPTAVTNRTFLDVERYRVDFANSLQCVTSWPVGAVWPHYRLGGAASFAGEGVGAGKGEVSAWLEIRLPAVVRAGDEIIIDATGGEADAVFLLEAWDTIAHRTVTVGEAKLTAERGLVKIVVNEAWLPDRTGLDVRVVIPRHGIVHALTLRPASRVPAHLSNMRVSPGHVVLSAKADGYVRSWGKLFAAEGWWPYPAWLFQNTVPENLPGDQLQWADVVSRLDAWDAGVSVAVSKLSNALKKQHRLRADADETIARLGTNVTELSSLLETRETARAAAEAAYARSEAALDLVRRAQTRRVRRVLVISHMFPHTTQPGSGTFVHEQAKALREAEGFDVRVISCKPYWLTTVRPKVFYRGFKTYFRRSRRLVWEQRDGVDVTYPPYLVGGIFRHEMHAMLYYLSILSSVNNLWKQFKFDIVHAHTGYLDGFAGMMIAKRFRVPFVVTEHTGPFTMLTSKPVIRQFTLKSLGSANRVICVSDALRKEVSGYFPHENGKRFNTIHNGVDTGVFSVPGNWAPDPARPKLLFAGALDDWKNPMLLLNAFAEVRKTVPGATLTLIGEGPLKAEVLARAAQNDLAGTVELTGHLERNEVARHMRDNCDLFVLPSKGETFGVVLIEALASGKPVIATNAGGPNDIIVEPWQGRLCEMKDPAVLTQVLLETIRQLPHFSAERISRYAAENFDYKVIANRLMQVYEEVSR